MHTNRWEATFSCRLMKQKFILDDFHLAELLHEIGIIKSILIP